MIHTKFSGFSGPLSRAIATFEFKICLEGEANGGYVDLGHGVRFKCVTATC